jgi:hypothetical protein
VSRVRGPASGARPSSRRASARRAIALLALLSLLRAPVVARAVPAQDPGWIQELGGVEATGLKRVTQAQLVSLAGLRAGQMIGPQDVEAARQRLLKSGLFTSIGYRYRTVGYLLIVTFTVQEVAWLTPVVFDNFVDHTDAQLIAGIARDVPTFDGLAPDQEVVLARIAGALERIARDSKDPGTVGYTLIYDKSQRVNNWRFHLDRASGPLPICAIAVAGLPAAVDGPIRERAASLVGVDYSRGMLLSFAQETVMPMLASQGATQAMVARVDVHREQPRRGCERGVTVTVSIAY